MSNYIAVGVFSVVLTLGACTSTSLNPPPEDIKHLNAALVFGYIEAQDDAIDRVDLYEYGRVYVPPFRHPPRVLVYDNGMFVAENLKPGKYIIAGFRSERNHYNMARTVRQSYQRILHVEPGEIQYAGSFQVRISERGKLHYGDFTVTQLQRPGERDLLKQLYNISDYTAWQTKVSRRLKELWQQ